MKEKLPINIKIEGRQYPVEIDRKDEEKYRKAAGQLNEVISKYRNLYQEEDSQNILAMTAFSIMLKSLEKDESPDHSLFIDELKNIKDDITDFLEEKR
jgi:cell division protein ZapA